MSTYTHTDSFGHGTIRLTAYLDSGRLSVDTSGVNPVMDLSELDRFMDRVRECKAEAEAARKAEAEAADKARLDQEALTLYRARHELNIGVLAVPESIADQYRRIALAARELHKDGNK